jgi:large subunit ribosomal protein L23
MSIFDRFKKDKEAVSKKSQAPKRKVASSKLKVESGKKTKAKSTTKKKAVSMLSYAATSTILAPVVSEKSAQLADSNVLVFKVAKTANRVQVRNAFRELYKVTPLRVNIINNRGKRVRFGRVEGKRSDWKKAMIFLPKGVNVDIFEGV